jgi:hypothetical protein
VAFEYASLSLFEALLWHDVSSNAAFDTAPGAVAVPAAFAGRAARTLGDATSLAAMLAACRGTGA